LIKANKSIVFEDERIKNTFLHQLHQGSVVGIVEFKLHRRDGKKSRIVKQNMRAITIDLMPSMHKKNLPKLSINAVLLEEIDVPPGEEPISWMFLTTLPIDSLENIQLIVKLYISRWGIEMFFKVLKSGCKIEELQFKEASRLLSCISLYMIVAWRVLFTTFLGRESPDLPCSVLFETDEWESVYALHMKAIPPKDPPKLGEFMLMIAALGGYQARKSQGPPGMIVIWKGLQKAYGLSEGWAMHREYGRPTN
jgi:IS4 transposase